MSAQIDQSIYDIYNETDIGSLRGTLDAFADALIESMSVYSINGNGETTDNRMWDWKGYGFDAKEHLAEAILFIRIALKFYGDQIEFKSIDKTKSVVAMDAISFERISEYVNEHPFLHMRGQIVNVPNGTELWNVLKGFGSQNPFMSSVGEVRMVSLAYLCLDMAFNYDLGFYIEENGFLGWFADGKGSYCQSSLFMDWFYSRTEDNIENKLKPIVDKAVRNRKEAADAGARVVKAGNAVEAALDELPIVGDLIKGGLGSLWFAVAGTALCAAAVVPLGITLNMDMTKRNKIAAFGGSALAIGLASCYVYSSNAQFSTKAKFGAIGGASGLIIGMVIGSNLNRKAKAVSAVIDKALTSS